MPAAPRSFASSQSYVASLKAFVKHSIEVHEGLTNPIVEVDDIGSDVRVIAFAREVLLFRLECRRRLDLATNA